MGRARHILSGGRAHASGRRGLGGAAQDDTPAVPVNTAAPVIAVVGGGLPLVGAVLRRTHGTWTGSPYEFAFTYQWRRDGAPIAAATASTYTLVEADEGTDVTCSVTGTNAYGADTEASNAIEV